MIKEMQLSLDARRERLRYVLGAVCIGIAALVFLLSFRGGVAQGLAAPLAPTAVTIGKSSVTSIVATNNAINQAVAGELVTVTVVYTVSGETIYTASPRVVLEDGLLPTGSTPVWSQMYTGTQNTLRGYEGFVTETHINYGGALVIFPDQPTIVGPDTITMTVYAVRTQRRYVANTEINDNTGLRIQGILRYCSDPSCTTRGLVFTPSADTVGQVTAKQPQVNTTYGTPVYLDSAGIGAGGGQVRLTFTAGAISGRPTAYDMVYTTTLNAGLTYVASSGAGVGEGTVTTVGDVTYVVWNVPVSLVNPQTWQAVVTATLPNPFTIGQQFTYLGAATYETFAGDVPYEGRYTTAGTSQTLSPGLSISKASSPASGAVTMGDMVTYTVVFTQAANTLLQTPRVTDTQPLGFHYISGTLVVQGANVTSLFTSQGAAVGTGVNARYYEDVKWTMGTLSPVSTALQVTATYVTLNDGLDFNGLPVYTSTADLPARKETITAGTGAVLSWTPPAGSTYNSAARANAGSLGVIQPYMRDNFSTLRTDVNDREVGQDILFTTRFRNNGYSASGVSAIDANELQVCDTLPAGVIFQVDNGCFNTSTSAVCTFPYTPPSVGAMGEVCWAVPALAKTANTFEFRYAVRVTDAAYPGAYGNLAFVETYSSKAGNVEGERVYDAAIPTAVTSATCGPTCYTILGLAAAKTTAKTSVVPGDLITYVLAYTDTSAVNSYTGLVMVDTYDPLLTFVTATPAPSSHTPATQQLTWNLGDLADNSSGQISVVMQVSSEVAGRYLLTNTMTLDSDQTALRTWTKTTPIDVAFLHVGMRGPQYTHAGGGVVYTVAYSNTGSSNNAPVTLTLDYGPYLTYVSAVPLTPVAGTQSRVFVDTVPNNGVNKLLTITLTTNMPLPYTLEEIVSTVELASPGAPVQTAAWATTLQRPVFQFRKMGPPAAAAKDGTMLYTFELVNTGDYTATGLIITDTWDTGTSFQSGVDWVLDGSGDYATYAIASLAPGATATVNPLNVLVDVSQDSYLNVAELSSAQTSVQTTTLRIWSPSIELAKTAYPDPAFPGRVLTYTLVYSNVGGFTIGNAVITDTLPEGFSYQTGWHTVNGAGCQSPGWQFSIAGQVATWTCSILDFNTSGQLQIWGLLDASVSEGTWLENMAESDGAAPVPYRPMDQPLRTLVARPWLRVNKVGAPTHPVAPGDRVTYTLSYENYGSYAAYDVVVKDQLPAQLTFAGCDSGCAPNAGLVSWTIGELPVAGTGQVVVYATVKAGTGGQTAVNSNYTIENTTVWQRLLPSETVQGAPVNTAILDPQLTLTKAAAPTVVLINDTIVYTITYANTGGGLLHNVVITDVLDIRTGFFSASAGCSHTGEGVGGTVTCQLGDLANGESRQIVISVRVTSVLNPADTIPNQAQGRTDEAPLTSSNTTTVWYQVSGFPEIAWMPASFTKSADESSTTQLQDTLTVSNTGVVNLLWTLEVSPTTATWLKVSVSGGDPGTSIVPQTTTPGGSTPVTVYFDPTGLAAGTYTAQLRILSNDSDEATVLVPVTFTIHPLEEEYDIYLPLVLRNN